jgi:hypothetical protein
MQEPCKGAIALATKKEALHQHRCGFQAGWVASAPASILVSGRSLAAQVNQGLHHAGIRQGAGVAQLVLSNNAIWLSPRRMILPAS